MAIFEPFNTDTPQGGSGCTSELSRSALVGLRNSGNLDPSCHYILSNPPTSGNLSPESIQLHAVDVQTLSMKVSIKTSFDNVAWSGLYDIDANSIVKVEDALGNIVEGTQAIQNFPWGVTSVRNNHVKDSRLNYTSGTVDSNTLHSNSLVTVSGGSFIDNVVASEATVSITANVRRNHFEAACNATINSGDFRENRVQGDATVVSNTTGDVDNNVFGQNSNTTVSGTSNLDATKIDTDANVQVTGGTVANCKFSQVCNVTVTGGSLTDTTVGEDAEVQIRSGSNFENVIGASTVYRQVGSGYLRYSTIEGTTTWINGDTNISNVKSYVSTINTQGSSGTIANTLFNRAYGVNLRNIPSLTILDSNIKDYTQFRCDSASRLYLYRTSTNSGARILTSSGARIDASYTTIADYGYLQCTRSGGVLVANYCSVNSLGYIRNTTENSHRADRCSVTSQSNIRFDGNSRNCRAYYCSTSAGSSMYHTGTSNNCYFYYVNADSLGQVYSQNSTNLRMYYGAASSRGYLRSLNASATHYMYYCDASASGYVQFNTGTGRLYANKVSAQSILEKRGNGGNIYYSSFSAYFYAYLTRTGGTSSGLFGNGRRTMTVTNPATTTPYSLGSAFLNFN